LDGAANAGNHLHLLLQAPSRDCLSAFLRAISGRIAQLVLNGGSLPKGVEFWDARPFSRLVNWGRDLLAVARYLRMNSTEVGFGMSREGSRAMFDQIQDLLARGIVPRSPELAAAGFI
jgi:hypothetical protein